MRSLPQRFMFDVAGRPVSMADIEQWCCKNIGPSGDQWGWDFSNFYVTHLWVIEPHDATMVKLNFAI